MAAATVRGMEPVHRIVEFLAGHLLVFLTFAIGLSLGPGELRQAIRRPAFWKGLVVALLAVPCLSAVVVTVLGLAPRGIALLLLMSVSPGAALMIHTVRKRGGDLALGAALSLTLTVVAILLLPLTLRMIDAVWGFAFRADVGAIFGKAALPVLVATVAGLAVRRFSPTLADRLSPISMLLFKIALVVVVTILALWGIRGFVHTPGAGLAAILITIGGAALGHLAGGPGEAGRRTVAIAAAYGNPVLVLTIVQLSYPDADALATVAVYLVLRAATLMAYLALVARQVRRGPTPRPAFTAPLRRGGERRGSAPRRGGTRRRGYRRPRCRRA